MSDAVYHFLSYLRAGFAASISQPDTFGSGQAALASAEVGVVVAGVTPATGKPLKFMFWVTLSIGISKLAVFVRLNTSKVNFRVECSVI